VLFLFSVLLKIFFSYNLALFWIEAVSGRAVNYDDEVILFRKSKKKVYLNVLLPLPMSSKK